MAALCNKCDLQFDGDRRLPKLLPCQHVACLQCLEEHIRSNGGKQCPFCRKVFKPALKQLTSLQLGETKLWCRDCASDARGKCLKEHRFVGSELHEVADELAGALTARAAALSRWEEELRAQRLQLEQEQATASKGTDMELAALRASLAAATSHPLHGVEIPSQEGGSLLLRALQGLADGAAARQLVATAEAKEAHLQSLQTALEAKQVELQALEKTLKATEGEQQRLRAALDAKKAKLQALDASLKTKEADLNQQVTSLKIRLANAQELHQAKEVNLRAMQTALEAKESELQVKEAALQTLRASLETREAALRDSTTALEQREAEGDRSTIPVASAAAAVVHNLQYAAEQDSEEAVNQSSCGNTLDGTSSIKGEPRSVAYEDAGVSTDEVVQVPYIRPAPALVDLTLSDNEDDDDRSNASPSEPRSPMEALPNALLQRVLSLVPSDSHADGGAALLGLRLVSRRWARAVLAAPVWRHRVVCLRSERATSGGGVRAVGRAALNLVPQIRRLDVDLPHGTPQDLARHTLEQLVLVDKAPVTLLRLSLSAASINMRYARQALLSGLIATNLRELDVEVTLNTKTATANSILQGVAGLSNLRVLRLSQRSLASGSHYSRLDFPPKGFTILTTSLERLVFGTELSFNLQRALLLANRNSLVEVDFGPFPVRTDVGNCQAVRVVTLREPSSCMTHLRKLPALDLLRVQADSVEALRHLTSFLDGSPRVPRGVHLCTKGFTRSFTLQTMVASLGRVTVLKLLGELHVPEAELAVCLAQMAALEELSYEYGSDYWQPEDVASVDWSVVLAAWASGASPPRLARLHVHLPCGQDHPFCVALRQHRLLGSVGSVCTDSNRCGGVLRELQADRRLL